MLSHTFDTRSITHNAHGEVYIFNYENKMSIDYLTFVRSDIMENVE